TRELAAKLHQDLMLCGEEQALDFVAVDMMHMEIPHLAILMYPNQLGYTHKCLHSGRAFRVRLWLWLC
ncbi:MAG: hypothetical protein IIW87_06465, partial [Alistipes sp.]|nr:hypothetical protein [Alistipes sp.]